MSEGYTHGLGGPKTKKDMENTSSTDSQDVDKEVNDPASLLEKAKSKAEDVAEEVKSKAEDVVEEVKGDN